MIRTTLFALLLSSPLALAAGGAWSSKSWGGVISHGQQTLRSTPLHAAGELPQQAAVISIAWQITPDAPPPADLHITLCQQSRCRVLTSLNGEQPLPASFSPAGPFQFVYSLRRQGAIFPVLTILSNQLTVRYRSAEHRVHPGRAAYAD